MSPAPNQLTPAPGGGGGKARAAVVEYVRDPSGRTGWPVARPPGNRQPAQLRLWLN